jgi:hypothetical protein
MSKMGSHDPFGFLKHKLWPKEGPGVKLSIWLWLSTTKSQESSWFPCLQVVWHILLKRSQWRLQLCFKPHLHRRFAEKIMGLQSYRNPNFKNFETPTWESWDKMTFGCWPRGSFVHQTCSNYALTNMLFGLFMSMWIIDLLVTLSSPHLGAPTRPSTPKVLQVKECAPHYPSTIFTFWPVVESIKKFGGASIIFL